MLAAAIASAEPFTVGSACQSTGSFSASACGSGAPSVSPSRSLVWLAKMITAMPAVNPTVTG